ncbi:TIGR03749 family integrating conjugative element protein [Vibrio splendidus]|uniref:Integrating conjugative element protein n=1 Tax=Vibrio splendidus TaxID=29497 RepID=A0A2N7JJC4_VIBSP|nr:TIGR03749 family integrating conjugative element protein [Vibrio splendidus]PMM40579.1 integrating conjugative element protein [Vibrio splendidus]
MRLLLLWMSVMLIAFTHPLYAQTPRAMNWEGTPLPVTLSVDKEMILTFDAPVRIGVPSLLSQSLSASSLDNRVYLTASQTFQATRLQVERLSDGARMLINLSATSAPDAPSKVAIFFQAKTAPQANPRNQVITPSSQLRMDSSTLLVRYAQQSLYSPSYAIEPLKGVQRTPFHLPENMALSTFPLWQVNAKPLAAWRLNGTVVTAIELQHQGGRAQTLDPRQVTLGQGCALKRCSVSFAHPDLGEKGSQTSTTTAFIVTPGSLSDFIYGGVSW